MIQIINVQRAFGSQQVLRGVSLRGPQGEILAVFGCGGSGKTVLLRFLIGIVRPNRGQIPIEDTDSTERSTVSWTGCVRALACCFKAARRSIRWRSSMRPSVREKPHASEPEVAPQVYRLVGIFWASF
jgi:ABC-type transporter Mla maintaining outer membrane lipid asymmetry ATPase subunit MlaF